MTTPKIKPCPFCDANIAWIDAIIFKNIGPSMLFVFCGKCCCRGPTARTEKQAIKLWNKAVRK